MADDKSSSVSSGRINSNNVDDDAHQWPQSEVRVPSSDEHGSRRIYMSLLLDSTPTQSPNMNINMNNPNPDNQAIQESATYMHDSFGAYPFNSPPSSSHQLAGSMLLNLDNGNNNNETHRHDSSENNASAAIEDGSSTGAGGASRVNPTEETRVGSSTAPSPTTPSLIILSYMQEPSSQVPPVNNENEQPATPRSDIATPRQPPVAQQQPDDSGNPQQRHQFIRDYVQQLRTDIQTTLAALEALQQINDDDDEMEDVYDDEDVLEEEGEDDEGGEADDEVEYEDVIEGVIALDTLSNGQIQEVIALNQAAAIGNGPENTNEGAAAPNAPALEESEGEEAEGNNGLDVDDILARMTREEYHYPSSSSSTNSEPPCCPICLADFKEKDMLGILDCNHKFHYFCIGDWLLMKNLCPLCRSRGIGD